MKIIFYLVCILYSGISFSQNIEITILDNNSEPLPFAHIYVDNKPVAISDTSGMAILSAELLSEVDTIRVSYIGANPAMIIYDKSLKEKGKYCFHLDVSVNSIDEIVVKYEDIKKLLQKNTSRIPAVNYNCTMNCLFESNFYVSNKSITLSGQLEAINEPISKNYTFNRYGWFHHPIKFNTNGDTSRIRVLHSHIHIALNFINLAITISQLDHYGKLDAFYSFVGNENDHKIFRISYPETYQIGYSYQILIFVDTKTKIIDHMQFEAVNTEEDKKKYVRKFSISCECDAYTYKKPRKPTILLPTSIHYKAEMYDGSQIDFLLSDIKISH